MIISVINHTSGRVSDEEFQRSIRAVNRQIAEDFAPYWGLSAELRLEGRSEKKPSTHTLADMRGDAVMYVWDKVDVDDALGYHDKNDRGIPFGFVFLDLSVELEEPWTVTLSHEALELIGDPETNLFVAGPHPKDRRRQVFHWYEMTRITRLTPSKSRTFCCHSISLPATSAVGETIFWAAVMTAKL